MGDKHFWDLIDWTNAQSHCLDECDDALVGTMHHLSPEDLEEFYLRYDRLLERGWTDDMAAVVYLVNRFGQPREYGDLCAFLYWLIDQGKSVYMAALTDPDSLADVDEEPPWEGEGYWELATLVWQWTTGRDIRVFHDRIAPRYQPELPELPAGGDLRRKSLKERFPRLYERVLGRDD